MRKRFILFLFFFLDFLLSGTWSYSRLEDRGTHYFPSHKQKSWTHIRTIISAREDKRRKIHSQNWNIIAPYAFQQPSTTGALHNPCRTAPCCISTWKDIWQCLGEKMFLFLFFFPPLMLFPSFKGTFDYATCSAQPKDEKKSSYLFPLMTKTGPLTCCYYDQMKIWRHGLDAALSHASLIKLPALQKPGASQLWQGQ